MKSIYDELEMAGLEIVESGARTLSADEVKKIYGDVPEDVSGTHIKNPMI